MIKGIDAQIMMQRGMEYSRDASAVARREDAANEFANRMQQLNSEQEMKAVLQKERIEQKRISRDAEREKDGRGSKKDDGKQGGASGGSGSRKQELPSVGRAESRPLLDIKV